MDFFPILYVKNVLQNHVHALKTRHTYKYTRVCVCVCVCVCAKGL